jgi:rhodanese-related sulfurtransferase
MVATLLAVMMTGKTPSVVQAQTIVPVVFPSNGTTTTTTATSNDTTTTGTMAPSNNAVDPTLLTTAEKLDAVTFKHHMDDNTTSWFDLILDVRTMAEWDVGHIEGSTLMESLASFGTAAGVSKPSDLAECVYCDVAVCGNSDAQSTTAIAKLVENGFVGRMYIAGGASLRSLSPLV